jgi:predicted metalloprotease
MPGSGKSTVGRQLARKLGVGFVDCDQVIEMRIGCPIKDFFSSQGEAAFRDIETQVIDDMTRTACGVGETAMGPFYCPADQKVYIDLAFNRELATRFGAPGEFAQAYVIAHEVGHHVQNLLGIAAKVQEVRSRSGEREANALSVRMELQADCFAGVWARTADEMKSFLDRGDIEQALRAASAIGDDRLQQQATGRVVPDSFTHGSSEQRVRWFTKGFETGSVKACDTFSTRSL